MPSYACALLVGLVLLVQTSEALPAEQAFLIRLRDDPATTDVARTLIGVMARRIDAARFRESIPIPPSISSPPLGEWPGIGNLGKVRDVLKSEGRLPRVVTAGDSIMDVTPLDRLFQLDDTEPVPAIEARLGQDGYAPVRQFRQHSAVFAARCLHRRIMDAGGMEMLSDDQLIDLMLRHEVQITEPLEQLHNVIQQEFNWAAARALADSARSETEEASRRMSALRPLNLTGTPQAEQPTAPAVETPSTSSTVDSPVPAMIRESEILFQRVIDGRFAQEDFETMTRGMWALIATGHLDRESGENVEQELSRETVLGAIQSTSRLTMLLASEDEQIRNAGLGELERRKLTVSQLCHWQHSYDKSLWLPYPYALGIWSSASEQDLAVAGDGADSNGSHPVPAQEVYRRLALPESGLR